MRIFFFKSQWPISIWHLDLSEADTSPHFRNIAEILIDREVRTKKVAGIQLRSLKIGFPPIHNSQLDPSSEPLRSEIIA